MNLSPEWIEYIEKKWKTPLGLVIAIIVIVLSYLAFICVKTELYILITAIHAVFFVSVPIAWFYNNRLKKTPKNKNGFIVCIDFPDNKEENLIREDFIRNLKILLKQSIIGNSFYFNEIRALCDNVSETLTP